ncbi:MAG TPA: hypothetical protein VNH21_13625 [Steroidobacteraceae bacterium]|nr:hypothetical protein [Steroidobacteraceae bacterium]
MATRYTVIVIREEYAPDSGRVIHRIRRAAVDYGLLQEAIDAVVDRAEKEGWFVDDAEAA